jgi:CBS-domain-containing membrane protein
MKVAEIMTRNVKTCAPQDSLNVAARIMWDNDCGCVPVVDGNSRVVGILTDRDVCIAAYTQGEPLHRLRVQSAMSQTVVSCASEDDLATAEKLMRDNTVHRLAVCDSEGRIAGIISLSDIAREAERERLGGEGKRVRSGEIAEVLGAVSQPRSHLGAPVEFGPEEGELEYRAAAPPKKGRRRR